ncbi:hypothetical protein TIFTF001_029686 [Ficus carica]|uniref:Uncharacterized protein n=1 Tax=Ficus carica TaxID=3494 RepID=A0AA88DSF8_FICCA|nr:hypothetical protein TIFTF001_029686 [Ficus carica]
MAMEPWSFDKSLLVLRNYKGDMNIDSVNFHHTCFRVQIHNLLVDDGKNRTTNHTLKECKAITEEVQESMYGDCLKASGLEKSFFWGRGAWRGGCGRGGGTPTGGRGKRNGRGLTSPRESRQKSQVMIPSDQELTGISNPRDSNDHNNSKILVNPSGNQERISNQNIGQDDESSDEMFSPLSIGAHKEHVGILKETKSDAALSYTIKSLNRSKLSSPDLAGGKGKKLFGKCVGSILKSTAAEIISRVSLEIGKLISNSGILPMLVVSVISGCQIDKMERGMTV